MPVNKSPLNNFPVSSKPRELVLERECRGDWEHIHPSMIIRSQAQLNILGKLYDWRIIRHYYNGVSAKFLGSNDSAIAPLVQRYLVERTNINKFILTKTGRRVYDLNYHWHVWKMEQRRERNYQKLEERRQRHYQGSLTRTDW